MLKVVVDTNNFVSSIINKKGLSAKLIELWRHGYYTLITHRKIIEEIQRVFTYPRITEKYKINKDELGQLIHTIESEAMLISSLPDVSVIKDDSDDDKFLACAIESKADYIVSGDRHLLNLHQYQGIPIVTAREFLKALKFIV